MQTKLDCNIIVMKKCAVRLKLIQAKVSRQDERGSEIKNKIYSDDEQSLKEHCH